LLVVFDPGKPEMERYVEELGQFAVEGEVGCVED
jgi:hypothetical protein